MSGHWRPRQSAKTASRTWFGRLAHCHRINENVEYTFLRWLKQCDSRLLYRGNPAYSDSIQCLLKTFNDQLSDPCTNSRTSQKLSTSRVSPGSFFFGFFVSHPYPLELLVPRFRTRTETTFLLALASNHMVTPDFRCHVPAQNRGNAWGLQFRICWNNANYWKRLLWTKLHI